jgi:hypothetical protein
VRYRAPRQPTVLFLGSWVAPARPVLEKRLSSLVVPPPRHPATWILRARRSVQRNFGQWAAGCCNGKARNSRLHLHNLEQNTPRAFAVKPRASAVSHVEDYRAKAKEYARLSVVTKSLREGRRYRKLAEMYGHSRWARNRRASPFKDAEVIMTIYPAEFHRRCQQQWERRAAARLYESARRMPWLLAIGRTLRAELDAVEQPVSERLAAVLRELQRRTTN